MSPDEVTASDPTKPPAKVFSDGWHCDPRCPYLEKWNHPFWHRSAWCWRNLTNLSFYDYWVAACVHGDATETMEKVRNAGRTKFSPKLETKKTL